MSDLTIRIINTSQNPLPEYATPGASGMDLRAAIDQTLLLKPLQRELVPTGLFMEIPAGYEAQVRPRSGIALKQGITCLNTPGTIDSDYRGEVKVLLINLSAEEQPVHNGDRIAQLVVVKSERAALMLVHELEESVRGEGGFGHTGLT
jgi:dUTP pyrophosphatase